MRKLKFIVLLRVFLREDFANVVTRLVFEGSGEEDVEELRAFVAIAKNVPVDRVKILRKIELHDWCKNDPERRRFFEVSLIPFLSSHVGSTKFFDDLFSEVSGESYCRGNSAGHEEAMFEH